MANFNTHITVAGTVAIFSSSTLYAMSWVSAQEMALLFLVMTLGGILPDIDSDASTAIKWVFNLLMACAGVVTIVLWIKRFSLLELWAAFLVIVIVSRWLILPLFASLTRHRGVFHSVLAGLFFWFTLTVLSSFHFDPFFSWLLGFGCFVGFLVHLILDEVYSVDLMNVRVKRSFGTALKAFCTQHKSASMAMAAATALALWCTPSADAFVDRFFSARLIEDVASVMLPDGTFFGVHYQDSPLQRLE